MRRALLVVVAGVVALATTVLVAGPASAHPLGNFTVNHLDQLSLGADGVVVDAVVDLAEIPTTQARSAVDTDGSGEADPAELDAYGRSQCAQVAAAQQVTVDGATVPLEVRSSAFAYGEGQAGLPTSRLDCILVASVELSRGSEVAFRDGFDAERIGWQEVVAVGDGVELDASSVPDASVTDGLRTYPGELLADPPHVTEATITVGQVTGGRTSTPGQAATDLARNNPASGLAGPFQRMFDDLAGRRDLTLPVGMLAVLLALVLGTSHALLPGHGKTIMAAYIAGREGSMRDAVLVGATVTGTHTSGVLLLGLALTLSTALAGEVVISWLGVVSGLFVAALGVALVVGHLRRGGRSRFSLESHHHGPFGGHSHSHGDHTHSHGDHDHGDGHTHDHDHDHSHGDHDHDHDHGDGHTHDHSHTDHGHGHTHDHSHGDHDHDHGDGHTHDHGDGHSHDHGHDHARDHERELVALLEDDELDREDLGELRRDLVHVHDDLVAVPHGHDRTVVATAVRAPLAPDATPDPDGPGTATAAEPGERTFSRLGLIGMGIAGGIVPSPSALIILLSAIALGRTLFGVVLVLAYGLGMAITLTLAGILLVFVRDRWMDRFARLSRIGDRWRRVMPYATAGLVFVVGMGLAIRSFWSL